MIKISELSPQAQKTLREYRRKTAAEYRRKHPEKLVEAQRRYWERKAAEEYSGNEGKADD